MKPIKFSKLALAVAISGAMVGGSAIAQVGDDTNSSDYELRNMKTDQNQENVSGNQGIYSTDSDSQEAQQDLTQSTDQDTSSQWGAQDAQDTQASDQQSDSFAAADTESKKTIQFEFDSADLTDEGEQKLQELAQQLKDQDQQSIQVKVQGFTDTSGPEEYNQHLAEQRAKAVQEYLESEGLEQAQIEVEARGEDNPVASNDDRSGRAQNRRVEVSIEGAS